jgi:hypothetical protein
VVSLIRNAMRIRDEHWKNKLHLLQLNFLLVGILRLIKTIYAVSRLNKPPSTSCPSPSSPFLSPCPGSTAVTSAPGCSGCDCGCNECTGTGVAPSCTGCTGCTGCVGCGCIGCTGCTVCTGCVGCAGCLACSGSCTIGAGGISSG